MAIKALARRGTSNREVARQLGVTGGTVRYHLGQEAEGAVDGHTRQVPESARFREAIDVYPAARRFGPRSARRYTPPTPNARRPPP